MKVDQEVPVWWPIADVETPQSLKLEVDIIASGVAHRLLGVLRLTKLFLSYQNEYEAGIGETIRPTASSTVTAAFRSQMIQTRGQSDDRQYRLHRVSLPTRNAVFDGGSVTWPRFHSRPWQALRPAVGGR